MRRGRVLAALAALAMVGTACSGGGDDDSSAERSRTAPESSEGPQSEPQVPEAPAAPTDVAAAEAEVKANVERYFDSQTPREEAFGLAEDVDEIRATLEQAEATAPGGRRQVAVKNVTFTSATEASYTFDLMIDGNVLLPDNIGTAVFEEGVWKVSRETNCGLTALAGFSCPDEAPIT